MGKYRLDEIGALFKNECERMSGYTFDEFVSRIKVNAYDALVILKNAMDSSGITKDQIKYRFRQFNTSDFCRKVDDQIPKPNNKKGVAKRNV